MFFEQIDIIVFRLYQLPLGYKCVYTWEDSQVATVRIPAGHVEVTSLVPYETRKHVRRIINLESKFSWLPEETENALLTRLVRESSLKVNI